MLCWSDILVFKDSNRQGWSLLQLKKFVDGASQNFGGWYGVHRKNRGKTAGPQRHHFIHTETEHPPGLTHLNSEGSYGILHITVTSKIGFRFLPAVQFSRGLHLGLLALTPCWFLPCEKHSVLPKCFRWALTRIYRTYKYMEYITVG